MKKILIVGNRKHQFIIHYVNWFKNVTHEDCLIDVFSYETNNNTYETDSVYDNIYNLAIPKIIHNNPLISRICRHLKLLWNFRVLTKYDVVHIHYVEDYLARFSRIFSFLVKNKLIISVWGSDYLKASQNKLDKMACLFDRADYVSIVSKDVVDSFKKRYYFIDRLPNKIVNLGFGLAPLDYLKTLDRKHINRENINITIGYNARKNQQHLNIIRTIEGCKDLLSIKERINFILPLTYPRDEEYIKIIAELIQTSKFSYTILSDFMKEEEVAQLRNSTDIFIQLQETDMMSGSMLEHMAAGNIVITGSWLPYSSLEKLGLKYWTIDNVNELSSTLYGLINNIDSNSKMVGSNRDIIFSHFLWETIIKSWISITLS